jgi:hypothetical protein
VSGTSTLDSLALVHRFGISQNCLAKTFLVQKVVCHMMLGENKHHGLTTNVEPVERLFMKQERHKIHIRLMSLVKI